MNFPVKSNSESLQDFMIINVGISRLLGKFENNLKMILKPFYLVIKFIFVESGSFLKHANTKMNKAREKSVNYYFSSQIDMLLELFYLYSSKFFDNVSESVDSSAEE